MYTYDTNYDENQCQDWCHQTLEDNDSLYGADDSFCCDLEVWTDGSAECYLYNGDETIGYNWYGKGYSYFTCMTFENGQNIYTGES